MPRDRLTLPDSAPTPLQIWRLVTAVAFFGKLGFPFLINMYFMYSYSLRLETGLCVVARICPSRGRQNNNSHTLPSSSQACLTARPQTTST